MAVAHKGSISMGLVLIPVGLYKTTVDNDIHFNQLCKDSKQRVQYKKYCRHCDKEVTSEDIIKGYEYEKGKYATFTIEWKDKQNKVILHPRKGNYSGMPVQRNLKIVKMDPTSKGGKIVKEIVYNGEKQIIKL